MKNIENDVIVCSEAQPESKPKIRARQIGGVPSVHYNVLQPAYLSSGLQAFVSSKTGLYLGVMVSGDGVISYSPINIPKMKYAAVNVCVEYTDYASDDKETICSLHLRYMDRLAKTRQLDTPILVADGSVFTFTIPVNSVLQDRIVPISLAVGLHSFDDNNEKRPILVRGAWVEFPE